MICPNCNKEIKFVPKGKCTCSCGAILSSDGSDVKEFGLSEFKISLKDRLPSLIEIQIFLLCVLVIGFFVLRVVYQDTWLEYEADFMFNNFGIDRDQYKNVIMPIGLVVILSIWLCFSLVNKMRKPQKT